MGRGDSSEPAPVPRPLAPAEGRPAAAVPGPPVAVTSVRPPAVVRAAPVRFAGGAGLPCARSEAPSGLPPSRVPAAGELRPGPASARPGAAGRGRESGRAPAESGAWRAEPEPGRGRAPAESGAPRARRPSPQGRCRRWGRPPRPARRLTARPEPPARRSWDRHRPRPRPPAGDRRTPRRGSPPTAPAEWVAAAGAAFATRPRQRCVGCPSSTLGGVFGTQATGRISALIVFPREEPVKPGSRRRSCFPAARPGE